MFSLFVIRIGQLLLSLWALFCLFSLVSLFYCPIYRKRQLAQALRDKEAADKAWERKVRGDDSRARAEAAAFHASQLQQERIARQKLEEIRQLIKEEVAAQLAGSAPGSPGSWRNSGRD